jgi:hypothetical protein
MAAQRKYPEELRERAVKMVWTALGSLEAVTSGKVG